MRTRPISVRTKVTLLLLLVTAAGFFFFTRWLVKDLRQFHLQSSEESLVDTSHLLAAMLGERLASNGGDLTAAVASLSGDFERVATKEFEAPIYSLVKTKVDLQLYVTDAEGKVVFDSEGTRVGQNYKGWNDVARTLEGRYGARSTRTDPEDPTTSILHVAAPLELDGEIRGVLTVRKPVGNVSQFVERARRKLITAGWLAGLSVAALGILLTLLVTTPIRRLTDYVRAIRDGKSAKLPRLGRGEIGEMGEALEEMRVALEGKEYVEEYVHALTHEFKSPIAAIQGAAELLEEDMPAERRARFLLTIRNESDRMRQVVDRLLQLASVENRKDPVRQPVDLSAEVSDLERAFADASLGRTFEMDIEPGLQCIGDRLLLRQAFDNLVANAVDFSPVDGVIRIQLARSNETIRFRVEDQGAGIPDYALDRLTERFYSLPRPATGQKSTGLGLSLVKAVADLHAGSLSAGNREGGGAWFEFKLPQSGLPTD